VEEPRRGEGEGEEVIERTDTKNAQLYMLCFFLRRILSTYSKTCVEFSIINNR